MHSMSISISHLHTRFISTKFRCTKFSDTQQLAPLSLKSYAVTFHYCFCFTLISGNLPAKTPNIKHTQRPILPTHPERLLNNTLHNRYATQKQNKTFNTSFYLIFCLFSSYLKFFFPISQF